MLCCNRLLTALYKPIMKTRYYFLILGIVIVAIIALAVYNRMQPEPVQAYQVNRKDTVLTITVTGEVRANRIININSPDAARIQSIAVDDGDRFPAGQVLATLEQAEVEGNIARARGEVERARAALQFQEQGTRQEEIRRLQAQLNESRAAVSREQALLGAAQAEQQEAANEAQRQRSLFEREYVSRQTLDQALARERTLAEQVNARRTEVNMAHARVKQVAAELARAQSGPTQAEIAQARGSLQAAQGALSTAQSKRGDRVLISQFPGLVVKRLLEPGETVTPGQAILRVINPTSLEVVAFVEEADLARVSVGDTAYVVLDALPDETLKGQVREVGEEVNAENGTIEAKIALDAEAYAKLKGLALRPGMTADINILAATIKKAILVPTSAVTREDGRSVVYRFNGAQLRKQRIKAQRVSTNYYVVLSGLQPGDWIAELASPDLLEKKRVKPKVKQPQP